VARLRYYPGFGRVTRNGMAGRSSHGGGEERMPSRTATLTKKRQQRTAYLEALHRFQELIDKAEAATSPGS
jgi:hypothetical protein